MKELNQLEERLKSLRPRSPSQKVKTKLFERISKHQNQIDDGAAEYAIEHPFLFLLTRQSHILSLIFVIGLLIYSSAMMKFSYKGEFPIIKQTNFSAIELVALSNQSANIAYYVPNLNNEHNLLTSQILRWTNYSGSN
ncbi:MAG: hypothetical protein ACP5K7_03940 [Verrucomicrobiia bacterium]